MYLLYTNIYCDNIQFVYYIMLLYNITEVSYKDIMSINKHFKKIKQFKKA
jgi:hypothetical protein